MLKRKLVAIGAVAALALVALAAPALASDHRGDRHNQHSSDRFDRHERGWWTESSRDRDRDRDRDSDHERRDRHDDDDQDDDSDDEDSDSVDSDTVTEDEPAGGTILTGSEQSVDAELTGYSYFDNTPAGSAEICCGVIHETAGGTGTFADPITTAVPGSGSSMEYKAGTRLYVPKLQSYFIVEDSGASGSGNRFDLYVDGEGFDESDSNACMESFTGETPAILNPADGKTVKAGPLTVDGGCKI